MTRLEKIAAKKKITKKFMDHLGEKFPQFASLKKANPFKGIDKKKLQAGLAIGGGAALASVIRTILKKKNRGGLAGLKARVKAGLKTGTGKAVAAGTAGVGLGALLSKNKG